MLDSNHYCESSFRLRAIVLCCKLGASNHLGLAICTVVLLVGTRTPFRFLLPFNSSLHIRCIARLQYRKPWDPGRPVCSIICLALGLWRSSAGGKFVRVVSCWLCGAEVLGSDAIRERFQGGCGGADYRAVDFDDPGYYEEVAFPYQ